MVMKRISDLERQYVNEVLDNEFSSSKNYSFVTRLEKEFAKKFHSQYAIAMVNGTVTLHAALEAAGVGEGDEVIVPALTMSSTNMSVLFANAIPVFADIDPDTWTISVEDIERKITNRTKAIMPVSIYGLSSDIDRIMEIAKRNNISVIEDDAQCFLGYYKGRIVGSTAHMSSFSFQAGKHMTSGEGGIVTTNDPDLALKLRRFSGLGYGSIGLEKGRISKDDIQSPDFERHVMLGWNYRPSDLCGAVALAQLERLDELVDVRKHAAKVFREAAQTEWLTPQVVPDGYENAYWTTVFKLDTDRVEWHAFRNKFMEYGGDGIYGAWMLGYMEPLYRNRNLMGREKIMDRYGNYEFKRGLCPVAEDIQPRLLQFKTNYWEEEDLEKQVEAFERTIKFFR